MKKRVLALTLALLMILMLCACGSEKSGETVNVAPEETAEAQPEGETPVVTVSDPEAEAAEGEAQTEAEAAPAEAPVTTGEAQVKDEDLVRVLNYIPDLKVDLKYATGDNYTGKVVYSFDEPYLRYGTVKKLSQVQAQLKAQGYELVLWDAFRPNEAQMVLYDAFPNGNYVANPYGGGHSSHTNGGTVDVALMKDGQVVELPSGFDEFSPLGDRDYSDVSEEAAGNAQLLEAAMTGNGFTGYTGEWWHYTDNTGYNYTDVEKAVLPAQATDTFASQCNEYINIRRMPNAESEAIGNIPNGQTMVVIGYLSDFAHIQYGSIYGYVNAHYIVPVND